MRKLIFIFILILGVTAIVSRVNAEMTGSSYKIRWDSVNTGGGEDISGSLYNLRSTMSEVGPGNSSGTTYNLRAGYRQAGMEIPFFYAELHAQDDSSQEAYSAFSNAGKTVTVADTTGYVVDDYIVVVENEGGSEMLAAGKIASVTPTVITVDKWSGDNATMSSSPAGGDDYVYELSTNTIALDTMITSVIQTGTAMVETLTNAQNGYACTITEDGNFRTVNGDDVNDVADGTVTIGSEEYGVEMTGDDAANTGTDNAIPTTPSTLDVMSSNSEASENRTAIIYKAAIEQTTAAGQYSHTTIYSCTGNY